MGAHGKHIILEASKLPNHFPKALRRIDMEIDALVSQVFAKFCNWLDDASFVIDVHETDKQGVVPDCSNDFL